jgi:ABC-2 type transport system permease protein
MVTHLSEVTAHHRHAAGRLSTAETVGLFVSLKLRLLGNGLKGSNRRLIAGLIGTAAGIGLSVTGIYFTALLRQADAADAYLVLVFGGSAVVLGWVVLPILIFGIDESLDPRRFVLLPLERRGLLVGMLAAGFVGIPAAATLVVALSTSITWSRGVVPVVYAVAGAVLTTALCVIASRTITAALSEVFRSRRVRDLWSVIAMLLVGSVAVLQFGLPSMAELATRAVIEDIGSVLAWTPLGAGWAAPHDAVTGAWAVGLARLAVVAATGVGLLVAWEHALRRSLESGGAPGHGDARSSRRRAGEDPLTPAWVRRALPSTVTGAVASRVLLLWWRDPRQRVSLLIVPLILLTVVIGPPMAGFQDEILVILAPGIGTLIGLMMLNHTAYDGTAIWAHLAVSLPGRIDRAGRALGTATWALPVVVFASVTVCLTIDRPDLLAGAIGGSVATVLTGLAFASVSSVVIAFPAPPASANPFITPGGGNVMVVLQQFAGGLVVGLVSLPVYLILGLTVWWRPELGWGLLVAGPLYGLLLLRLGNRIGGRYLDQHGPELLRQITPTRT